jgi:repressor LexA
VKTLRREEGKVVLVPSNDAMEPLVYDPREVTIYGRVVTVLRKL